jgi:hypothetical protein
MKSRFVRIACRTATEVVVGLVAIAAAVQLWILSEPWLAAAVVGVGGVTSAAGLWFLWRQGELQLAWRCPRLDGLGVRPGTADAPWEALKAAEGAVLALDEASARFPDFFPEGRRDLLKAVYRTLEAHRRQRRMAAEATRLPDSALRRGLEVRAQQAREELASLVTSFGEIRSRLVETASAPRCEEGGPLLGSLRQRSQALAEAVHEVDSGGAGFAALPVGERA